MFEDETVIALDLQRILREAGFRVVGPATSLEEAKALLARGRIDCAILDLDAAQDRAPAVADVLAEAGVPLVLIATNRESVPRPLARHPVVEKPYSASSLLDAVHEAMRSAAAAAAGDGIVYPIATTPVSFPRIFPQL